MVAGGKRKGAGRKPSEPTKQVRVPEGMLMLVKELIRAHKGQGDEFTAPYLLKMLDRYSDAVWECDFFATMRGGNSAFQIRKKLRKAYYEGDDNPRIKHIFENLEQEI